MHGESFVYPLVTTSCSEEIVQNFVEFKQAYIALQSQDQQVLLVLLQNHRLPSSLWICCKTTWICWKSSLADC